MEIRIADFVAGASAARGIAVIIDVFRAFSLAPYAFSAGVRTIYPVADIDEARRLKQSMSHCLLLGERHAVPPPDFDGGNSPAQLSRWNLLGREIIHTTHAGTQGLMSATQAEEVLTGSFVNASAIVRYLQARNPEVVTLVRMGYAAQSRCEEDDLCAEWLAAALQGHALPVNSSAQLADRLRHVKAAEKFFDPACSGHAPEADFTLCTELDRFDFILRLERSRSQACLVRVNHPWSLA